MTDTFFADISRYQHVVDSTYPGEMIAFRADSGFDLDEHAEANWAYCQHAPKIQAVIAYVVFIPGAVAETVGRVKHLFGAVCPAKVVFEVDDESGKGFAGPGDHSAELNQLVALLDAYSGAEARELEYGNRGDLAAGWSAAPRWLKRITAAYTGTDPGSFGWQYYGGVAGNPVPAGYPTSWPPFGSAVDMNVIHLPIDAIVAALGLAPEDDMPYTIAQLEAAVETGTLKALQSPAGQAAITRADQLSFHDGAGHQVSIDTELAERLGPVLRGLGLIETDLAAKSTEVGK